MSETLYEKVAALLGRPVKKSVDTDDADSRIGDDAKPDDKKLEGAGEEATAGGQAGGDMGGEGGQPAGVPENPGAEGDDSGEGGEPDGDEGQGGEGDGDGDEDLSPDEIREMRKAFGLTVEEDIHKIAEGKEVYPLLNSILSYMQKQDAFNSRLSQELADLKKRHASGEADSELRGLVKSFEESVDTRIKTLQDLLAGAPKTAPAAGQPKAFLKANPEQNNPAKITLQEVEELALKGQITGIEAARLSKKIQS